jgi:mycothiol synthase
MLRAVPATGSRQGAALNILYEGVLPEDRAVRVAKSIQEAEEGELDLRGLLLAELQEKPVGALLLRMQPHGVAFLWPPVVSAKSAEVISWHTTSQPAITNEAIEDVLLQAAVLRLGELKARIAQSLLELNQTREQLALSRNGFRRLTDLIFFEYPTVGNQSRKDRLASDVGTRLTHIIHRQSRNRLRFAEVVEQTYRGSLDCPELNGIRTASQALNVYAESGPVVRDLWRVYCDEHRDVGVILVVDRPEQRTWEVIYLGVVESARRCGVARKMLTDVINAAHDAHVDRVVIVADVRNRPAVLLYQSLGFAPFDERVAYVKFSERC